MAIFRQYIAPLLVVIIFLISLVAVSARIFLPQDMAAPAPVEEVDQNAEILATPKESVAELVPDLEVLLKGLPLDSSLGTSF